jgi:hypothetical protein
MLAYIKLRKRNLGPLLDANGWAVNSKAKINVPFGRSLTQVATLPPGSQRDLFDPFADKKKPWGLYVALLVLAGILALALGWYLGKFDGRLPQRFKSAAVLGTNAPAYVAPANAVSSVVSTNAPAATN